MKSNKKILALALITSFSAQAAEVMHLDGTVPDNMTATTLQNYPGLGEGNTFSSVVSLPTRHQTSSVKLVQYYHNIPVYGHHLTIEEDKNHKVVHAYGDLVSKLTEDAIPDKPVLSEQDALSATRKAFHLEGTHSVPDSLTIKKYIYIDKDQKGLLVYKVDFLSDNRLRPVAFIDATSGTILEKYNGVRNVTMHGPGGNEKTGRQDLKFDADKIAAPNTPTRCYSRDDKRKVFIYKQTNVSDAGSLTSFDCLIAPEDPYNGGFSPVNDTLSYVEGTIDMYVSYLGVKPWDGIINANVNYYDLRNSGWLGNGTVFFGGGDKDVYPYTIPDVVAHELGHAFTEKNDALSFDGGPAKAINESFSDMSGEVFKYYLSGSNDFLHGKVQVKPGVIQDNGQPMIADRYLCDPPQDGKSIDNQKDYQPAMEEHYASGIYNKAFCLLAKSDGWNTRKAFGLFARANTLYWSSHTDFNSGACDTLQAARDEGEPESDIINAFAQVGVKCQNDSPKKLTVLKSYSNTSHDSIQIWQEWSGDVGYPATGYDGAIFALRLDNATATKWNSSSPDVASVDNKGVITIHRKGSAVITAMYDGGSLDYPVDIKYWFTSPPSQPGDPLNSITWTSADAECRSLGKKLPDISFISISEHDNTVGNFADEWNYGFHINGLYSWSSTPSPQGSGYYLAATLNSTKQVSLPKDTTKMTGSICMD
ncbi:M4 family metallopeptidase [Enterobacter ludwigii]|uniref:M4 family metallopeptidase n=1 Tax=Enterobacter ludwigii TaxID=299767 RepID=UPI000F9CF2B2